MVAFTIAEARWAGSPDLKIPEPTNTPSAPSCIIIAASAGGGDPARGEQHDGQLSGAGDLADQLERGAQLLGGHVQLGLVEGGELADLGADRAHVPSGLDDVAGARLALGPDHGRALGDAAQRLAQVGGPHTRTAR